MPVPNSLRGFLPPLINAETLKEFPPAWLAIVMHIRIIHLVMSTFASSCSHIGIKETLNKDPNDFAGGWERIFPEFEPIKCMEYIYLKK